MEDREKYLEEQRKKPIDQRIFERGAIIRDLENRRRSEIMNEFGFHGKVKRFDFEK